MYITLIAFAHQFYKKTVMEYGKTTAIYSSNGFPVTKSSMPAPGVEVFGAVGVCRSQLATGAGIPAPRPCINHCDQIAGPHRGYLRPTSPHHSSRNIDTSNPLVARQKHCHHGQPAVCSWLPRLTHHELPLTITNHNYDSPPLQPSTMVDSLSERRISQR